MTSCTTQIAAVVSGGSTELINATFEYCEDFTGDGLNDVKVTLALDPASNSGTEDLIGVAFDVSSVANLVVSQIMRSPGSGTLSSFEPLVVIGDNQVSDSGPLDPGFNTSGGNLGENGEPYDVGIKVSDQGSGEGIVQSFSFVLSNGTNIGGVPWSGVNPEEQHRCSRC